MKILQCGRFQLDVSETKIMGVLNCTPDSFSDGGQFIRPTDAIKQAEKMIDEGVDIIDIGAESTRPGAKPVTTQEEIIRLKPVVERLVKENCVPISVDTRHAETMRVMLDLGVDMINDVNGFEEEGAMAAVASRQCAVCIMHMRGIPENMQSHTDYADVISEVRGYLRNRAQQCQNLGIESNRIILDPGFGFAKTPAQNMLLIKSIEAFLSDGFPLLLGVSRKSTIGYYLNDRPVSGRLIGSVVLAALASDKGANIIRVHDVAETKDALKMVKVVKNSKNNTI